MSHLSQRCGYAREPFHKSPVIFCQSKQTTDFDHIGWLISNHDCLNLDSVHKNSFVRDDMFKKRNAL